MINEFSRTELLIGTEAEARVRDASVMVFGVGGVGSHCIEALARCGVGKLTLIDNDRVSLTNINRQSIAYHSTVGRYKTEVMRERIRDICPDICVDTYEMFVLPDNIDALFGQTGKPDYIIDGPLCRVMRKELKNRGIIHLKVLYSEEKPVDTGGRTTGEDTGARRSVPGSISFVPPAAGLIIAGEVIRTLAGV